MNVRFEKEAEEDPALDLAASLPKVEGDPDEVYSWCGQNWLVEIVVLAHR